MAALSIPFDARWVPNATTVAGNSGLGNGLDQLHYPHSLYIDEDGSILITDYLNHRVVEWKFGATSGTVVAGGNNGGNQPNQLQCPTDVIVDKETNSLIICDSGNKRVVQWARRHGTHGKTLIENIGCRGLTMNKNRRLYVTDEEKHEIRQFQLKEENRELAVNGRGTLAAGGNGQGDRLDQLDCPHSVFVDDNLWIYVSDSNNHRVVKWRMGQKEGKLVAGGQGNGSRLTQLHQPNGVFVDSYGNVYVGDHGNHRVMRWCREMLSVSVIAGGNKSGTGAHQLHSPEGLSFDQYGHLYVVDSLNNRVLKYSMEK